MKYEMIFGDEGLFDGVRDGIVALRFVSGSGGKLLHCKEGQIDGLVEADLINHPIVAMRRIIKEPKQWTWEDKKAGRLPEVGVVVFFNKDESLDYFYPINEWLDGDELNVLAHVKAENGIDCVAVYNARYKCTTQLVIKSIKPIESPEEKAARLRSEWCNKAAKQLKNLEYSSTLTSIYDALLSGDLPMPKKGGE